MKQQKTITMKKPRRLVLLAGLFLLLAFPLSASAETSSSAPYHFASSQTYTYDEMLADIEQLQQTYQDCLTVSSLGTTADGRDLCHLIVGDPAARKQILITGSIHAREYLSTQLVMMQVEDLLRQYQGNSTWNNIGMRTLMADTAVHFVPMINPDGVTLCQLGLDAMKLPETRQKIYQIYEMDQAVELGPYFRKWKSNAMGVDLNRNFDARWDEYNDHLGHPSADHYKGVSIESEIESKALVDLTRKYRFDRTISYHTQGNVIYWYFGQSGDFMNECQQFAELVSRTTGYVLDADYTKLDPAGYKDWALDKEKIPSLTVEVGTGSSPVDPNQLAGIWAQNKDVCPVVIYSLSQ